MKVVIIGSGGLAREFCSWFGENLDICGFATKSTDDFHNYNLPGKIFSQDITADHTGTACAVLAVGSPALKEKLYQFYVQRGFYFPKFIHKSSLIAKSVVINEGCIVAPNVVIGPDSILNKGTYVNFSSTIAHDVTIGEFCQINPSACINGGISIGNKCTIGANTTILQGISITDNVVTAIGSAIFSHVKKTCTMIGNPAKRLITPSFNKS